MVNFLQVQGNHPDIAEKGLLWAESDQARMPKRNHLKSFCTAKETFLPILPINTFSGLRQMFGSLV
jgi:hypothetical protein